MFRNNVGVLEDKRGNKIRYGLAKGSADLIGVWTRKGDSIPEQFWCGQFLSIEVKRSGCKPTKEQIAWGEMVRSMGGIHIVATSVADVEAAIQ